jgi:hypothetical protein
MPMAAEDQAAKSTQRQKGASVISLGKKILWLFEIREFNSRIPFFQYMLHALRPAQGQFSL